MAVAGDRHGLPDMNGCTSYYTSKELTSQWFLCEDQLKPVPTVMEGGTPEDLMVTDASELLNGIYERFPASSNPAEVAGVDNFSFDPNPKYEPQVPYLWNLKYFQTWAHFTDHRPWYGKTLCDQKGKEELAIICWFNHAKHPSEDVPS